VDDLVRPEILNLRFEGYRTPKASQAEDLEIKDLNSETKRFNLNAKVTEKSSPRTILSRWGTTLLLSTATITDRSGTIKLPLWKDQVGMISVGDLLRIENARLKRFRGELQVKLDRMAKLRVVENEQNRRRSSP
jgi:replication factor A1